MFIRVVVLVISISLILLGLAYLYAPVEMFSLSGGHVISAPASKTDIRAMYGALQVVLGGFLLWKMLAQRLSVDDWILFSGLFAALLTMRLVGVWIDGSTQTFNLVAIVVESFCLGGCLRCWWLSRGMKGRRAA